MKLDNLLVSLVSWLQIKESPCWSVIFSYFTQQRTIFHSDCDEQGKVDCIWQLAVTSSVEGLSKRLQSTSQSQTCTKKKKKGPSHCLVFYCRSDPLQLSESWWNHSIWEVCSANRWDALKTAMPEVGTGQQKRSSSSPQQHPTTDCITNASKVEWIGFQNFTSSAIFTWPLANQLPLLHTSRQLAAGKALPHPAGGRKCFPRIRWIPKHRFLCYKNKPTYFLLAKMCWL